MHTMDSNILMIEIMNKLFNWLVIKPNKWYDSLHELFRFLIFIVPICILNTFFLYITQYHIFGILCVLWILWRSLYLFKKI